MINEIMKHPEMHPRAWYLDDEIWLKESPPPIYRFQGRKFNALFTAEQLALTVRIALEKAAVVGGHAAEKTLYSDGLNVAEAIRAMAQSITVEQPKT